MKDKEQVEHLMAKQRALDQILDNCESEPDTFFFSVPREEGRVRLPTSISIDSNSVEDLEPTKIFPNKSQFRVRPTESEERAPRVAKHRGLLDTIIEQTEIQSSMHNSKTINYSDRNNR